MKKKHRKKWDRKRQQLHELIVDQIHDSKAISVHTPIAPAKLPKSKKRRNGTKVFQVPVRVFARKPKTIEPARKTVSLPADAIAEIERLYQERLAKRRLREESKG